nr:hypothetical protein BaRGS_006483 [Batillaria attramentaria]
MGYTILSVLFVKVSAVQHRSSHFQKKCFPSLIPGEGKDPRPKFREWRRQYGDVFSLYMGGRLVVVLNGYDVIKEALVKNADVFSDRPSGLIFDEFNNKAGIAGASGTVWKEQRTVSLEILRQLGMGRNTLASKIQEEVTYYIKALNSYQGQPVDIKQITHISVSNNICSIIFGRRFEYDDTTFQRYMDTWEDLFSTLGAAGIVSFLPWIKTLPGDLFRVKKVKASFDDIVNTFLVPQIQNHNHDHTDGDNSDFIHAYIEEIHKRQESGKPSSIDASNLAMTVSDLFSAGTETTATAIRWALVFLQHYPHVQDTCYQQIARVVGTSRAPSMQDKPQLTYVEATIMEVLRRGNIAPMILHGTSEDTTFRGHTIPKDTVLMVILESAVLAPDVWDDPLTFRPERFLDSDGKLVRSENFIPFSLGRRVCLGESLSRMELFLYLTTMIQHFRFLPPEDGQLPSLEGTMGITNAPGPFKVRLCPRE